MFFSSGSDTSLLPFNTVPSIFEGSIVSKEEFVPVSIMCSQIRVRKDCSSDPSHTYVLHAFDILTMRCLLWNRGYWNERSARTLNGPWVPRIIWNNSAYITKATESLYNPEPTKCILGTKDLILEQVVLNLPTAVALLYSSLVTPNHSNLCCYFITMILLPLWIII